MASSRVNEEVSNKAMYALARLVAGPASAARSAFYNMGGLPQLQALLGSGSGASTRVKTRAVNLVSDLIGGLWPQVSFLGSEGGGCRLFVSKWCLAKWMDVPFFNTLHSCM